MKPLADLRIIAVEQYGAGPFGTVQLADLGADVIKIEDPRTNGDVGRSVPPYNEGCDSLFFETFNRNKRSVALDITTEAGRAVLLDLVRVSDAVYCNLRGDVPETLRIRYADLAEANPAIVCCALSAFGSEGSHRDEPGYDYLIQGMAGWMSVTGEPGGPPEKTGLSLVDYAGGYVSALSLLAAVHAARRTGRGTDCDLSLYGTTLSLLTYLATWHLTAGYRPERTHFSAHPSLVPCQNFRTADGWIVVMCAKQKFWLRLCTALGRPDLADDPRFRDAAARLRNRDALLEQLERLFVTKPSGHWLTVLRDAGVPCGPVLTVEEALAEAGDSQEWGRQLIAEIDHPRFGTMRQVANPIKVGGQTLSARRAPRVNEDADDVLAGLLGYGAERIEDLAARKAFG